MKVYCPQRSEAMMPPELELQIVVSLPIFWELPPCMGSSARAESLAISLAPALFFSSCPSWVLFLSFPFSAFSVSLEYSGIFVIY